MNILPQDIRVYTYFCHLIYPFKYVFGQLFWLMTEALVLCCLKMYFFVPSVISNGIRRGGEGGRWEGQLSLHFSFEYSDFPFFKSHASDRAAY